MFYYIQRPSSTQKPKTIKKEINPDEIATQKYVEQKDDPFDCATQALDLDRFKPALRLTRVKSELEKKGVPRR